MKQYHFHLKFWEKSTSTRQSACGKLFTHYLYCKNCHWLDDGMLRRVVSTFRMCLYHQSGITSVSFYETTRRIVLKGCHLRSCRRENLKSHIIIILPRKETLPSCRRQWAYCYEISGPRGGEGVSVFWIVMPCSLVGYYQRFRRMHCLHLQSENGGDTFL
jgi:hypothetical protein